MIGFFIISSNQIIPIINIQSKCTFSIILFLIIFKPFLQFLCSIKPFLFFLVSIIIRTTNNMDQLQNVPTLYYPAIRGVVQPVRYLFLYLDQPYREEAIINQKQVQPWFMSGYPRLQHEQVVLTQAISIFKYICRILGRPDLLGLTPQNRAVIHEFLFCYNDLKRQMMKKISKTAYQVWSNPQNASKIKLNALKLIAEECCPMLVKIMKMHMKTKGWLLGYATILDFFFYEICFYLTNFLGSIIVNHPIYRNFYSFKNFFEKEIQIHQKRIPQKKIFPQFKNQQTLEVIKSAWQGQKTILA